MLNTFPSFIFSSKIVQLYYNCKHYKRYFSTNKDLLDAVLLPEKDHSYPNRTFTAKFTKEEVNFIAIGTNGCIVYRDNGNTEVKKVGSAWWTAITKGNGKYVTVGDNGYITSSTDGINWSTPKQVGTNNWNAIVYGSGRYMVVGDGGYVTSSVDGINWASPTRPGNSSTNYVALTFGDGKFAALNDRSSAAYISINGATWEGYGNIFNIAASSCRAIGYGKGQFISFGASNSAGCYANVSTDGYIWKNKADCKQVYIDHIASVAYGNEIFVAISGFYFITSTDGLNWARGKLVDTTSLYLQCLTFGNGYFVTGGRDGAIYSSSDKGKTWNKIEVSTTEFINSIYVM